MRSLQNVNTCTHQLQNSTISLTFTCQLTILKFKQVPLCSTVLQIWASCLQCRPSPTHLTKTYGRGLLAYNTTDMTAPSWLFLPSRPVPGEPGDESMPVVLPASAHSESVCLRGYSQIWPPAIHIECPRQVQRALGDVHARYAPRRTRTLEQEVVSACARLYKTCLHFITPLDCKLRLMMISNREKSMASRCNSIFLMFLLWFIAAPKLTHQLKNLVKVPNDVRVPGCYFIHISQSASVEEMQALVDELRTFDANTSLPEFDAKDIFTITKLSYGFSAKLSDEALLHVSCNDEFD